VFFFFFFRYFVLKDLKILQIKIIHTNNDK